MNKFKIVACFVIVVAALAYAGLPPIVLPSGLAFKAPKSPTITFTETNGWVVIRGTGDALKDTIALDKTSAKPTNMSVVIERAKAFKASRKDVDGGGNPQDGNFASVVYGVFTNDAVGDFTQLVVSDPAAQLDSKGKPGKSFALSLKGITVGTVIAKKCAATADSISHALLTEVKLAKGVTITAGGKAPLYGILGGGVVNGTNYPGTLGLAPGLTNYPTLAAQFLPTPPAAPPTELGKATAKNQMRDFMIFSESIPAVNGKAKASLSSKIVMLNVNTLTPGTGTNSSYKAKFYIRQDLTKPF